VTSLPDKDRHPVVHFLLSLQGGYRSMALHGPDDPEGRRALDRLRLAFGPVWGLEPQLALSVSGGGMAWKDKPIPGSEDPDGIGARLHEAGIAGLEFSPGVEAGEIIRFLQVLRQSETLTPGAGDDLSTLLWREDFQHLRYTLAEPASKGDTPSSLEVPAPPSREVRAQVREEVTSRDKTAEVVEIEKFDSTLYFLDQAEINYLQDEIEKEYARDHATDVVSLLLDTFELQRDPGVRKEVLLVLEELLPHLLEGRNFKAAGYMVSEIRTIQSRRSSLTDRQARVLDRIVSRLSGPEALAQLFHTLEDAEDLPRGEDLAGLLSQFRADAVETLLPWLQRLSTQEAMDTLAAALLQYFKANPSALRVALRSQDSRVAFRALDLVRRFRLEAGVDELSDLSSHPDAGVRAALVPVLAATPEPAAVRHLTRMIDDPDSEVRIGVLRALAARPYKGALKPLEEILEGQDLEEMELGEKRVLFETYATLAGQGGVPLLTSLLQGKGGFGRRTAPSDTRACAALALGEIGTPPARRALEKALRDRDPVVRSAAKKALT
jgi:hypothetical protein